MKLQSMVSFVLEQYKLVSHISDETDYVTKILNYASFLKQPLNLEMFIPCGEDGLPMLEPGSAPIYTHPKEYIAKWQAAKDRVLFEGFVVTENAGNISITNGRTSILFSIRNYIKNIDTNERITVIEDLPDTITLTPTAVKQLNK